LLPLPIAGLPGKRAWVRVGPPLSASGPSSGFWPSKDIVVVSALKALTTGVLPIRLVVALTVPSEYRSEAETTAKFPARTDDRTSSREVLSDSETPPPDIAAWFIFPVHR